MEEDYTKVPEERPSYSPIPPDKPPKKGGAAAAVIITAILILLIAGIGTAAYLLLNTDSRSNASALNSMTPAEYLLWVESNALEEQKESLREAAEESGAASFKNGLTRQIVISGSFTEAFAEKTGLQSAGNFSVTLDSSVKDSLMGITSVFLYGGTELFRTGLSIDTENQLGMLRIPELADGWYDFSDLYDSSSPGGAFLASLAEALQEASNAGADLTQSAIEGLEFSSELYQTALSYFGNYELATDRTVKANNVESSYTQITASVSIPTACDMLAELITLIQESSYINDVMYGGNPDGAEAFKSSLAGISTRLPAISASFSEEDILTYTVWVDDEGIVRGRELAASSAGTAFLSLGSRLAVSGRTFGYSAYLTLMGNTIIDIHGTASGRSDSLTGEAAVSIPTYLYPDTYTDPIELTAQFEDLGAKDGRQYGEIILSLSVPEELAGDSAANAFDRYHLKLSLPKDEDDGRPALTLSEYSEELLILTVSDTLTEDFTAPEFAGVSDAVYNADTADQYFSRENWLAFLDRTEQRMNEPNLADFFDSLRNAFLEDPASQDGALTDNTQTGPADDTLSDGFGDTPTDSGNTGTAQGEFPSMAAVKVGDRTLTTRDLPYYFVDFMEDYSFYEQTDLDYYGESYIKEEILNRIHRTLACSHAAKEAGLSLSDEDLEDLENRYYAWIDYPYIAQNTDYTTWPWDADALKTALTDVILAEKYRDTVLAAEGFDEEAVAASVPVPVTWEVDEFVLYKSILDEIEMTEDELLTCLETTIDYYNHQISDEVKRDSIQQDNLIIPWLNSFELAFPDTDWQPFYNAVTGGYGYLEWYTDVFLTPDNTYYPDELKAALEGTEDGELSGVMDFGDSFLFFYQWDTREDPEEYELARYFAVEEAKESLFENKINELLSAYPVSTLPGWFLIEPGDFVYQSVSQ